MLSKRQFISSGAGTVGLIAAPFVITTARAQDKEGLGAKLKDLVTGNPKEEVTPPEDLMREHGVLDRVLLVYEAAMTKFNANADMDPAVVVQAAEVVRDFINDYHEKSEEQAVFPRFRSAGKMVDLVDTLVRQHDAGRHLTQDILRLAPGARSDQQGRAHLLSAMQSFIVMYRPHAAREDTDLFPKLRSLVSAHEYDAMAEDFEKKEHALFGEDGFERMVDRVANIERAAGINDLNRFTPQ